MDAGSFTLEVPYIYLMCKPLFYSASPASSRTHTDGSGERTSFWGRIIEADYALRYRNENAFWVMNWELSYENN